MALADEYDNVVGVTAAMPSGTGLSPLIQKLPKPFLGCCYCWTTCCDIYVCDGEGFKPYITIYSTFCNVLMTKYPWCVYYEFKCCFWHWSSRYWRRGWWNASRGIWHLSYLSAIPNMTLMAPRDEKSMHEALKYSYTHQGLTCYSLPKRLFLRRCTFWITPFYARKSTVA